METYGFYQTFEMGCLIVSPVHVRVEQLPEVIAAHRHSNASYEIHYTAQGQGTVEVEGKTFPVAPGIIYITGPGVIHSQRAHPLDPVEEYCLYLNCKRNPRYGGAGTGAGTATGTGTRTKAGTGIKTGTGTGTATGDGTLGLFAETLFWYGIDNDRIFPLLKKLVEENRTPMPDTWEMSEILLRQIILQLTRMYRQDSASPFPDIHSPVLTREGMIPVIEDAFFYRYKDLTIAELAEMLHFSVRQTQRILQEYFGKTFTQKLTEARMAAASQMLMNSRLSITAISDCLGYSSIEHFSSAFRREVGCSPVQYRKQFREQPGSAIKWT